MEKIKFENLEKLDLSYNEIADIIALDNINLKKLKDLNLNENKITDKEQLEK